MANSRKIEVDAAAWLVRRDGAGWTVADDKALSSWLNASTAHKVAFIRLELAWKESARLKALGAGVPAGIIPGPEDLRRSPFFRRARRVVATAGVDPPGTEVPVRNSASHQRRLRVFYGSLAASVLLGAWLAATWLLQPLGANYRTAIGALQTVSLRDGSKVTLNTDTYVRVSVTPKVRRVDLERGEAFFEVAKDPMRPFVVRAGQKQVVAIGTKFAVWRDADQIRVLVTEGTVRLESAGEGTAAPIALVPAGHIARTEPSGVLVAPEPSAEREAALSWRRGYLVFHETPIAEAVAEFNRYNTRRIVVEDPSVAAIRIGGNFRSTSSETFVRLLCQGFPVRAQERGDEIVLTHQ